MGERRKVHGGGRRMNGGWLEGIICMNKIVKNEHNLMKENMGEGHSSFGNMIMLHTHGGLCSISRSHIKKSSMNICPHDPSTGETGMSGSWGSLTSQSIQLNELQPSEKPSFRKENAR